MFPGLFQLLKILMLLMGLEPGNTVSKIIIDPDAPATRLSDHLKTHAYEDEQEILLGNGKLTPTGE